MKQMRPTDLRTEAQRQLIMRMLLLGLTAEQIARKLNRTARTVRYQIASPKFQAEFERFQAEYFKALDKKMAHLLREALRALAKNLKHPDWRCRDAATEKVLRMHGRYIEK